MKAGRWSSIPDMAIRSSWSGPSVTQANVRSLTSTGVYAYVAGHACQTGIWNATESFAETWVIQENKGALVYLGASDYTYWDEDDVLERMMFDALFAESQPSISAMLAYGHTGVRALSGETWGLYYREEYHIFGDPSVKLRLAPQPDFSLAANPTTVQFCSNGQGTTSLDLTSINDFSGQVDLIVTTKPAGVTATFYPTQVVPTGSSLLTLADDGSTMPFVYQVSVQGTSGSLTHTTDLTLIIDSVQVATLLTPADDATDQWIFPTFSWETMDGGMSYTFELDDADDFVTPLLQVSLTEPTYTPASPLLGGSTFYWRVRATNDCGETLSSVYNFTTSSLSPLHLYLPNISN